MTASELDEIRAIERKWQDRWFSDKIFEPQSTGPKKYFLTTPYPYTSGPQHIGHTRTYNVADIHARFMRMNGYNVLWPMAWHITGTPILAISSCIERCEGATIALYENYVRLYEEDESRVEEIVNSFVNPWNIANYFAAKIIPDFQKMGFSIDWSRQFTTGDPIYNQFIRWQYEKLMELGLIVSGQHPILYCTIDQNAVGEDDIAGGDVDKISIDKYIGIKFSFEDAYIVTATLRPETVFAVTNLWVAPSETYVKAYVDGEKWIISPESASKLRYQQHDVNIIEEFRGSALLGGHCVSPVGSKIPILPASFVDVNYGTGIVMSVPAHAPYDWAALNDLRQQRGINADNDLIRLTNDIEAIKPISLIKIEGYGDFPAVELCERFDVRSQRDNETLSRITNLLYRAEFYTGTLKPIAQQFEGRLVRDVKEDIVEFLKARNAASTIYETSAKGLCRCGGGVVVAIEPDQYFLNYGDPKWKAKAFELLDQLKIVPDAYRAQFVQTFHWLDKRPCVRRRGLGTTFPFSKDHWIIEPLSDSVIYMALYTVIKHLRECDPEQLTPAFFDFIFLGKGDLTDVSQQTGLSQEMLRAARNEFTYWYPNDHRHTAVAHISNHLSFFLFHHAILFPKACWPRVVTLNELLIREGVKMSKSRGNVIPIATVPEVYSADLVRLCLVSIADLNSTVDWRENEVEMVKKRLLRFWHAANSDIVSGQPQYDKELSFPSRWILAATNAMVSRASEAAHQFSYRKYVTEAFFEQLNRVEEYRSMVLDSEERCHVLLDLLNVWLCVLAPVIPHIAEELWERMHKDGYISLAVFPQYNNLYAETLVQKRFLDGVIGDVSNIQAALKRETASVFIYLAAAWKYKLFEMVYGLDDRSLKQIMARAKEDPELRTHLKDIARIAPDLVKLLAQEPAADIVLGFEAESETLLATKEYLSRRFGKDVSIFVENSDIYDPANRARRELPAKPAIYVE